MLQKRKGMFKESVDLYVEVLVQLSAYELIHILFDENFDDLHATNKHMVEFNNLFDQIVKICEKHGSRLSEDLCEDLWLHSI